MTREKVIYSIERCICHVPDACRDCAYDAGHPYNECIEMLLKDVLELLKEQKLTVKFSRNYMNYVCSNCGVYINDEIDFMMDKPIQYCQSCGRRVKCG